MHIAIEHGSRVSPGEQLRSQLALLVVSGTLSEGTRLPSVRQLAADLGLAPGTVARVYRELERSGHLTTSRSGTRVAALGKRAAEERRRSVDEAARIFVTTVHRAGATLPDALAAVHRAHQQLGARTGTRRRPARAGS